MLQAPSQLTITTYSAMYYPALKALMTLAYADMGEAYASETEMNLLSELYPQGQLLAFCDDVLVGLLTSRIVPFATYSRPHTQAAIADTDSYVPDARSGNSIYGLDTVAHPDYGHLRIGYRLTKEFHRRLADEQFEWLIGVSRVSSYSEVAAQYSIEDYVARVVRREQKDKSLSFHLLTGQFDVLSIAPNFNPDDRASQGYGIVMGKPLAQVRAWQS
jgi:hypothetical protein